MAGRRARQRLGADALQLSSGYATGKTTHTRATCSRSAMDAGQSSDGGVGRSGRWLVTADRWAYGGKPQDRGWPGEREGRQSPKSPTWVFNCQQLVANHLEYMPLKPGESSYRHARRRDLPATPRTSMLAQSRAKSS